LRNLSINGIKNCVVAGWAGLNGTAIWLAAKLIVESARSLVFHKKGIDVNLGATGSLAVKDTTIETSQMPVVMRTRLAR